MILFFGKAYFPASPRIKLTKSEDSARTNKSKTILALFGGASPTYSRGAEICGSTVSLWSCDGEGEGREKTSFNVLH